MPSCEVIIWRFTARCGSSQRPTFHPCPPESPVAQWLEYPARSRMGHKFKSYLELGFLFEFSVNAISVNKNTGAL